MVKNKAGINEEEVNEVGEIDTNEIDAPVLSNSTGEVRSGDLVWYNERKGYGFC